MPKRKKKGPHPKQTTAMQNRAKAAFAGVALLLALVMLLSVVLPLLPLAPASPDGHSHDSGGYEPYFEDGYWFIYNEDQGYYEGVAGAEDNAPYQSDGIWYAYDTEHGHYHPVGIEDGTDAHGMAAESYGSAAFALPLNYQGPQKYVDKGVSPIQISRGLTKEQRADVDTAYRFFIYLMDKRGFTRNATIGVMTYMMAEGGSYSDIMQGTYTYQTDWIYPGPSGVAMDKTEDNLAWIRWLNGAGYDRAKYESGNCNIGLGLTQESDVWWYSRDNKTTSNATALITAAMAEGVPWQDPAFQVNYIIENKLSLPWAWDLNDVPGPDPRSSHDVSALEWATRVWCGVGMPSYISTTAPAEHPDGFGSHIAGIPKATKLYDKYSGCDPWFYKLEANWHNPFSGPEVDGVTPQGLLIARMALLLSGEEKVIRRGNHSYTATELVGESTLSYYRQACHSIGKNVFLDGEYFASADVAVSTAILLSGVDNDFPRMYPGNLRKYMMSSPRWEYSGRVSEAGLSPGDVLIAPSPSDLLGLSNDTARHIMIWVGEQVAHERFPNTDMNVYDASLATPGTAFSYYPCLHTSPQVGEDLGSYYVFRCVDPQFSSTYWDKFIQEHGSDFPEIPKAYTPITKPSQAEEEEL